MDANTTAQVAAFVAVRDDTDRAHGYTYDHQPAVAGPFATYQEADEWVDGDDRFVVVAR